MTILFIVLAAVAVFAIAAGSIGREAHRLDAIAPRAVYRLDEATDFVCDRLPTESQARLTPVEVGALLVAHMGWLHTNGLQPDRVVDLVQSIDTPLVADEDALLAHLFAAADEVGVEVLDDVDIVSVLRCHHEYFDAIGAVGPLAAGDDLIDTVNDPDTSHPAE